MCLFHLVSLNVEDQQKPAVTGCRVHATIRKRSLSTVRICGWGIPCMFNATVPLATSRFSDEPWQVVDGKGLPLAISPETRHFFAPTAPWR